MNASNITRKYKEIYQLSKYSNITTDQMESQGITEETRIPIKSEHISTKNKENQEEDIEMEIKIGSKISSYREGEYIDANIGKNEWDEDRFLWWYTEVWYLYTLVFLSRSIWKEEWWKIEKEKNKKQYECSLHQNTPHQISNTEKYNMYSNE